MKTITSQNSTDFNKIFLNNRDAYNPKMEKNKRHLITFYQL